MLDELREAIEARGHKTYDTKDGFKCQCLFHNEDTPSMVINKSKGIAHCFGCGKTLSITELATFLKVQVSPAYSASKNRLLTAITNKLQKSLELPADMQLLTKEYRGISVKTLQLFKAFTSVAYPNSICFPIYKDGKLIEILQNNQVSTDKKYIHHLIPGIALQPAPLDLIATQTIYLVEGIYDMLTMYDLGYTNTLSLLGTNQVYQMPKIIKEKGINHIISVLDGDNAGRRATQKLQELVSNVEVIELPDGEDPNSLGKNINSYLA